MVLDIVEQPVQAGQHQVGRSGDCTDPGICVVFKSYQPETPGEVGERVVLRFGSDKSYHGIGLSLAWVLAVRAAARAVNVKTASAPFGPERGSGSQPIHRDPSRFLTLRDYHPTDPMKHIDWNATARRSELQTKVFEPVVSLDVLVTLNATTGEHAWQGTNRRLFERSVTVAASVAKFCGDRGYSFGLVSNSVAMYSGKWINVPSSSSDSQIGLVLEALAVAGSYAVTGLPDVLRAERVTFRPGTTVALVTALVTRALKQEIFEIKAKGYTVIVFYSGDGGLGVDLPGVPIFLMGQALEKMDTPEAVAT